MRRMVAAHPEVEFVFFFDRAFDPDFIYGNNVQPVVLFPPARHPFLWYIWFEWSLPRALRKAKVDVFFSPDSFLSLSAKDTPVLMTVHDVLPLEHPDQIPWLARMYYQHFLPRYMHHATHLLAVSGYTKLQMEKLGGVQAEKISVVYNGSRTVFHPLDAKAIAETKQRFSSGKSYFFYSGSIHPRKNIHRLIAAFDLYKAQHGSDAMLLIGGRMAWDTNEVTKAYEEAKFKDDIRFLGYVAEVDLPLLMGAAEALVLVSIGEGFGLPLVEAMQVETPIVCSNVSALPEVAGEAAVFVDPYSVESIAEGLFRVHDTGLRAELIQKMRTQRALFDWDRAAEAVFQELVRLAKN
jgi:glycosyltransferase involved in cell wall biosynthesis